MRVLMFNSNISRNSGVMSVIMNYYRNVNKEEVQFDFMYFRESELSYENEITQLGGRCFRITSPKNFFAFIDELDSFFRNNKEYEIVHIHDAIFARLIYKKLKKNSVKRVIVHSHATRYSDKKISELRNMILCHNIEKYADVLFACSIAAGKFMFDSNDFFVMRNAIDSDKYFFSTDIRENMRCTLNIEDKFVVGHIGAFVKQKNHKFLIEIFKSIFQKKSNALLVLAGDGPLMDEIKTYARELSILDKILFLGKRKDAEKLYQAMDVFVLPSIYEGLPMVGVEAQCAGLPVVFSSNITEEVGIDNYKFLSLKDSADFWAEEIIELYEKHDITNRLFGKNKIFSAHFDIQIEANGLIDKYREILEG